MAKLGSDRIRWWHGYDGEQSILPGYISFKSKSLRLSKQLVCWPLYLSPPPLPPALFPYWPTLTRSSGFKRMSMLIDVQQKSNDQRFGQWQLSVYCSYRLKSLVTTAHSSTVVASHTNRHTQKQFKPQQYKQCCCPDAHSLRLKVSGEFVYFFPIFMCGCVIAPCSRQYSHFNNKSLLLPSSPLIILCLTKTTSHVTSVSRKQNSWLRALATK